MADPFQDVDAAGPDFIKAFAESMETRQADPAMERIVATYLAMLDFAPDSSTIEIGAGAGAVSRRIAAHAAPAKVVGFEPSKGFVAEAEARALGIDNLSFQVASGTALPLEDGSVDQAILHTVLTHVTDQGALVAEAHRVLKPGGRIVICDADFSKATFSNFADDPLDACARAFVREFVTDAHTVAKLRPLLIENGFRVDHFDLESRVVLGAEQMLPWVVETSKVMVARGDIGKALADALSVELHRRAEAGTLYGYQAFATAIGTRS